MTPEQNKLNMGCGFKKLNGYWNVDSQPSTNPDELVDLEICPWPWDTDFFEGIHADNVLEHVGGDPKIFTEIIKEMYRVSKDQSEWYINIPHHRCDNYFNDYTHVRMLTSKTFSMFDQTVNYEAITNKLSDSTYGIYHNIDIELIDVRYNLVDYWRNLLESGMIGQAQLNINMNTMSNVAESVSIFCKIHKPGRLDSWIKSQHK